MHVIDVPQDVEYLKWLRDRLFSETRMDADVMRDAGNRLYILINRVVDFDDATADKLFFRNP